jgi:hypothetical protein
MKPARNTFLLLLAAVLMPSAPTYAQQGDVLFEMLPKEVLDAFAETQRYSPYIVLIVQKNAQRPEVDEIIIFEVPGFPRSEAVAPDTGPEVTIQDVGSKLVCTKYGCFTVRG